MLKTNIGNYAKEQTKKNVDIGWLWRSGKREAESWRRMWREREREWERKTEKVKNQEN